MISIDTSQKRTKGYVVGRRHDGGQTGHRGAYRWEAEKKGGGLARAAFVYVPYV